MCYARELGTSPLAHGFRRLQKKPEGEEQSFGISAPRQGMPWLGEAIEISRAPGDVSEHRRPWELLANNHIKTAEGLERIAKLEKTARKRRALVIRMLTQIAQAWTRIHLGHRLDRTDNLHKLQGGWFQGRSRSPFARARKQPRSNREDECSHSATASKCLRPPRTGSHGRCICAPLALHDATLTDFAPGHSLVAAQRLLCSTGDLDQKLDRFVAM